MAWRPKRRQIPAYGVCTGPGACTEDIRRPESPNDQKRFRGSNGPKTWLMEMFKRALKSIEGC